MLETEAPSTKQPSADWQSKVPSVSQLTRRLRGHLEKSFTDVWVRGEVSNLRVPPSGHAYFLLKDATAQLRVVMFRSSFSRLRFDLEDGADVIASGRLSVYEARGEYQLICGTLQPVGIGALQLAFEQLKKKLSTEGLFDEERKKTLPYLPKRIGVITSPTGAAVRDILKVLHRRFPKREVFVIPTLVQGNEAAPQIVNAILKAEAWNDTHPERAIEALIVGRGGGSIEDLWPFNEETVARALAACPIPIISAVGHEIDFTIADFVADLRAPTPSAAAEMILPEYEECLSGVELITERLVRAMESALQELRLHLDHLTKRLVSPSEKIAQQKQRCQELTDRMKRALQNTLTRKRSRLEGQMRALEALSPLAVLGARLFPDAVAQRKSHPAELRPPNWRNRHNAATQRKLPIKGHFHSRFHRRAERVKIKEVPFDFPCSLFFLTWRVTPTPLNPNRAMVPTPSAQTASTLLPLEHIESLQRIEQGYWWYLGRLHWAKALMRNQGSGLSKDVYADIGCGTGGFAKQFLAEFSFEKKFLVDGDEEMLRRVQTLTGANKLRRDFSESINLPEKADCITCMDVIEHIKDDKSFVHDLADYLKPNGVLIATVPAHQWLFSDWDKRLGHHRRYSKKALRQLFENTPLEIKEISYMWSFLTPMGLIRKHKRIQEGEVEFPKVSPVTNHLLHSTSRLEWYFRRFTLFGTSLILCATKK